MLVILTEIKDGDLLMLMIRYEPGRAKSVM
jgi:hypothetical protein